MYEVEQNWRETRERKHHYWRGFRSGIIVSLPFIFALMWGLKIALDAMTAAQ